MIEKDNNYWNTHKEVFNDLISELDTEIINRIYNNPNCHEGRLFQKKVDRRVEELLTMTAQKILVG